MTNVQTLKDQKKTHGCPWPDTDGDGVADKDDKCPTVKGTVANNGCPEVSEEAMKKLNDYAKTILFDSGKSSFQQTNLPSFTSYYCNLKRVSKSNFFIEGHTDSDGNRCI